MPSLLPPTEPTRYAHVIVPLPIREAYTYAIPEPLLAQVVPGKRVEVQFGAKRVYAGMVKTVFEPTIALNPTNVKPIISVLDTEPILSPIQLKFWEWMATYYLCTEGEVMQAALPSAYKLSSESKLVLNPLFGQDFSLLDDREYMIAEALTMQPHITIPDVQLIVGIKTVMPIIKSMLEKGIILVNEELVERYQPREEIFIALNGNYLNDENLLAELFNQLSRAPKQEQLLLAWLQLHAESELPNIMRSILLKRANAEANALDALIKKGVFTKERRLVSRLDDYVNPDKTMSDFILSPAQNEALRQINDWFASGKRTVLLHGVTASGKTQIYIRMIEEVIETGKQALFLLPEIALTVQMITRLRKVFGNQIGISHSKFNDAERIEIWQSVLNGKYKVIVGPRSAMFLPYQNLGLVIIDEEHDPSYKQHDPAPRYIARDAAIYLANLMGAQVVLGSATPAIETYYNATQGKKFGLVTLNERFGGVEMPAIETISLRALIKEKKLVSIFTPQLIDNIKNAIKQNEQVILFQNRRGYAPFILCTACEWIPRCHQCDVSLTYHKHNNSLRCHYCGYFMPLPSHCPECKTTQLTVQGFGTEKVEEYLKIFIPDISTSRLDLDTARTKHGFDRVITDFQAQKTQVLVGTQMITKGLDFERVNLVGVLNADHLLDFPDFRAAERAFQLLSQVSGRAGRRQQRGTVLIQAFNTKHRVLHFVIDHDYTGFYKAEIEERRTHRYPPFARIVVLNLKHPDRTKVNTFAEQLAKRLKQWPADLLVLGPTVPIISKVRNYYLRHILIKILNPASLNEAKMRIAEAITHLKTAQGIGKLVVYADVDPAG